MIWLVVIVASAPSMEHALQARAAGQLDAAETALESFVAENPLNVSGWVELGVTRAWAQNHTGALAALRHALALDPDHLGARTMQARVLSWRGDWARAGRAWRALQESHPDDPGVLSGSGSYALARSNRAEARSFFAAALKLDPTSVEAKEGLQRARSASRTTLHASGGPSLFAGRLVFDGTATVQHKLRPDWDLGASYSTSYWSAVSAGALRTTPALNHRATVWAAHRFGTNTLAPAATVFSQPEGEGVELAIEGARRVAAWGTVTGRVSSGYRADGEASALFDTGFVFIWKRLSVDPGVSVALPYADDWRALPRLRVAVQSPGWSVRGWTVVDTRMPSVSVGGQVGFRWLARAKTFVAYETFIGPFEVHTVRVGFEVGL